MLPVTHPKVLRSPNQIRNTLSAAHQICLCLHWRSSLCRHAAQHSTAQLPRAYSFKNQPWTNKKEEETYSTNTRSTGFLLWQEGPLHSHMFHPRRRVTENIHAEFFIHYLFIHKWGLGTKHTHRPTGSVVDCLHFKKKDALRPERERKIFQFPSSLKAATHSVLWLRKTIRIKLQTLLGAIYSSTRIL